MQEKIKEAEHNTNVQNGSRGRDALCVKRVLGLVCCPAPLERNTQKSQHDRQVWSGALIQTLQVVTACPSNYREGFHCGDPALGIII